MTQDAYYSLVHLCGAISDIDVSRCGGVPIFKKLYEYGEVNKLQQFQ